MEDNFKDKTVIITGGSEGIGAATARKFAAAGANLVLVARGRKKLEKITEELKLRTRVMAVPMDVADPVACINLCKKAEFEFSNIHVLVNNAGFHQRGPVDQVSADDLGRMVDVNLKAPIQLCRIAIPYLRKANGAAIINVASLAGRTPVPGAATYCATKSGLRAFTFALAEELKGTNIKLAVASPGPVDTGFIMDTIDVVTDITFSQPLSSADEVADVIYDLARNEKRERSMPPISGFLTTLTYLFPPIGRLVRPMLEAKGRKVKRQIKAKMRAEAKNR
jgi:short-subunit dehydrogenase